MFLLKGTTPPPTMSSGGKGKTTNIASFIKEHFNIVGNSILVMVLLGVEKLMDLEFRCPSDRPLAIVYSLVFLVVPTIIVGVVACYLSPEGMCCQTGKRGNCAEIRGGTEEGDSSINVESKKFSQNLEMVETKTETESAKCGCCCANVQSRFFEIKVVVIWVLIVITDGRYGDCFVRSVDELIEIKNSNISHRELLMSWTEVRSNYLIHLSQIVGLIVILLVMIVIVFFESRIYSILSSFGCKCGSESESERYRRMNEDNLLQITEDILQEEARQRQKEFVETLLSREDWASYDPGSPNALEELEKITAKWKEEVKRQLEGTGLSWSWPDWAKAGEAPSLGTMLNGGPLRKEDLLPPHPPAEP